MFIHGLQLHSSWRMPYSVSVNDTCMAMHSPASYHEISEFSLNRLLSCDLMACGALLIEGRNLDLFLKQLLRYRLSKL